MELLLKRGSRVGAVDSRGETPFYLALRNEHESTATILLNTGGADPNERDHGCQMAIAKFLDCMRLAPWVRRTMAPLGYAAKFDPFLSLDCARVEGVGAQS